MPHAQVNGIKMYYEVEGAGGAPWLTFSNSLRTDHTMWAPQIPDFARDFRDGEAVRAAPRDHLLRGFQDLVIGRG